MNYGFCEIFKNTYLVEQLLLYLPYCIPVLVSTIFTPGSAVSVCDIATTKIANNKDIPIILPSLSEIIIKCFSLLDGTTLPNYSAILMYYTRQSPV